ncbi:hypothetical protein [Polyangium mundeleinium]|uniref:Uncharacterized protein n=1 Tax=Polyangium mundeleinium TaxID=2995306 RepID=A0ABT5F331_9BACT|nr:hypothetical protein [Polyangium mundeleinium]MDC0747505.1 hypothetical protein [Polyangium mundeleinium]
MSRAAILEASLLPALALCAAACREPPRHGSLVVPAVSATPAVSPDPATLFSGKLAADQPSSSGRADLDGDGAEDCWEAQYRGGSGSGGELLKIESPCGGPASTIDTTSSFGHFLSLTALPPAIGARPRLVEGVIDLLYGRAHLRQLGDSGNGTIDGSFHRLLDDHLSLPGPESPPFAQIGKHTPVWTPGPPALPPSQVVVLSNPAYRPLASSLKPAEDLPPASPYALLAYHAHNHHGLKQVARCGPRSVYTTDHGVIVHDTDRGASSWVFVSTGVTKLRHPSLGRVVCAAELVAADRHIGDGARELVVTEPRTGRYGRIPLEGPWSLDERALTVGEETYAIEDVVRALSRP